MVLPGTYAGNRSDNRELEFESDNGSAKNIVLKSRDGAATTFIDSRDFRSFEIDNGTDTTLQIIGFTITSTSGGSDDDQYGALVKIFGIDNWDQFGNYIYTPSSVVFRNCIFTIFDSGELLGEDLQDVAVRLYNGVTIFDNCEFTNITVDYTDYSFGDGSGGAVRADGTSSTLHFNQSKLTNITVKRTDLGYIHGAVLSLDGEAPLSLIHI